MGVRKGCLCKPRSGAGPALPADTGSACGWPQAGLCCAPVPKKATSQAAGLDPALRASACLAPAPQLQLCPAASTHLWVLPPLCKDTLHSGPIGSSQSASRERMGSLPPCSQPAPRWGMGVALAFHQPSWPQTSHQDWAGRSSHTRSWPGAESHWDWPGTVCCRGLHQHWSMHWSIGSYTGLGSSWILTWDWSGHGFSHRIGQHMDSQMALVSAQILTLDWSIPGFQYGIGQNTDSHARLVRAVIPAEDWSVHRFSHGTGQQMDSDM